MGNEHVHVVLDRELLEPPKDGLASLSWPSSWQFFQGWQRFVVVVDEAVLRHDVDALERCRQWSLRQGLVAVHVQSDALLDQDIHGPDEVVEGVHVEADGLDQGKVVVVLLGLVAVHIQSDALLDQDIHGPVEVVEGVLVEADGLDQDIHRLDEVVVGVLIEAGSLQGSSCTWSI